jgi:hypothetical protein
MESSQIADLSCVILDEVAQAFCVTYLPLVSAC